MRELVRVTAPEASEREWLKARAEDVVGLAYRQACDTVRIGAILNEVRKRVGHGRFLRWVEDALPFSNPTANRYRLIARTFAAYQSCQFDKFDLSALYVLAQAQGVPKEARDTAVSLAEQGQRITHALAKEIVASCKVTVTDREVSEYHKARAQLDRVAVTNPVSGKTEVIDPDAEKARLDARTARENEAVGALLVKALGLFARVEWERDDDDPERPMYWLTGYADREIPRKEFAADVRVALEKLTGSERRKNCRGCCPAGPGLLISEFGRNDDEADGWMPRCRNCEKGRKREMRRAAKAKRAASAPPPPPPL